MLAAFIVAMWAVGTGWRVLRLTWEQPTAAGVLWTAIYAAILVAAVLYLGFWVYAADRAAGKVQRRIALYERFLRRRNQADA